MRFKPAEDSPTWEMRMRSLEPLGGEGEGKLGLKERTRSGEPFELNVQARIVEGIEEDGVDMVIGSGFCSVVEDEPTSRVSGGLYLVVNASKQ